jgi:ABC-type transport system involved in multi-copper enzyme maturation permease subunit
MNLNVIKKLFFKSVDLYQFAGPIFDKELRVTSRRKRYYVLRFVYLAVLGFCIVSAWGITIGITGVGQGGAGFRISRMSEVGKGLIVFIVWFQFITAQLLAVVLLSTSISDEIYHRTLGVLMTTPISSFQIVAGKLLSRLFQMLLLLGISFPLLAIIRVFGGVPWMYVVSSLMIILASALLAGSVSMLFSIFHRRAHEVILKTAFVCGMLYVVPMLALHAYQLFYGPAWPWLEYAAIHSNPFMVMAINMQQMYSAAATSTINLPLHIGILFAEGLFCFALSVFFIRRVGLRQATGEAGLFISRKLRRRSRSKSAHHTEENTGSIRPVIGPPIIWKEIRSAFFRYSRFKNILTCVIIGLLLIAGYGFCFIMGYFEIREVQVGIITGYFLLLLLRITSLSATSVTIEKESRTWPVLLTTPLNNSKIVFGKIFGSILRCWPLLILLFGHLIFFILIRCIHPIAIFHIAPLIVASCLFFSSTGVLFSVTLKRTSTASILNLLLFFLIACPVCAGPCAVLSIYISPLFHAVKALYPACGTEAAMTTISALDYATFGDSEGFWNLTLLMLVMIFVYIAVFAMSFIIARDSIRKRIFASEK